jgi:hypothetical protein
MANREYPHSSRLFFHIGLALSALACFCCVPYYSAPYIEKQSREQAENAKAGKPRARRS